MRNVCVTVLAIRMVKKVKVFVVCVSGVGQGIDTSLSEMGLRQAEAAGQYLQDLCFTNAFVSNLQRAIQVCVCTRVCTCILFLSHLICK